MKLPIYECTNQYNEFSEQLYPVNISNVKWVNLICDKYPNGCIQISCHDAQENAYYATRLNEEYEREDGKYLVERNKISIYDVMDKLHELYSKKLPDFRKNDLQFEMKNKCHDFLKRFKAKDICKAVILLDDYDGLSNWDCCETDSLEEAIEIIDGGYGILPLVA